MKRTFAALSIVLLLFSFTACSNESGGPAFTGDAQTVASQLKPADLVKELLAGGTPDGDAVISYDLIAQEEGGKALEAGIYLLKVTVDFKSYETAAGTIIDGTLVYEIPGTFTGNSFIEDGSCSIRTEKALVIETADGNVPVTITDLDASLTVSVVSIGTDDKVTAVTAEVSASASMEASVDGDPVEVPPVTDTSHDTTPDIDPPESDTEYDAADAEEFAAMLSAEGQVRLVDDFTITGLSFEGESKSFTIDLNEHTLTLIVQAKRLFLPVSL